MDKSKTVTYSEIAGELRKASRHYEIFKHAAEAAVLLANVEKENKKLEAQKDTLIKEQVELNKQCDSIVEKANKAKQDTEDTKYFKASLIKEAKTQARVILDEAKTEAEKIIQAGVNELSNIKVNIEATIEEGHIYLVRKDEAIKSAQKAEKEFADIKAKILKTIA